VRLVLVAATIAIASVLQSASGFGFSLIAVPIVSALVGARVAVVATDTLAFGIILSMVASGRQYVRVAVLRVVTIASLIGMPVGLWVLTHVDDRILAVIIACVVILLTVLLMSGVTAPDRPGIDLAAGFTSGVLSTSTGTNGPPLVLALQARRVPSREFRTTLAAAFALQDIAAILGFAITRQFTSDVWRVVAVGIPGLIAGRVVGDRLFGSLDQRRFRGVALTLLLVTGTASLVQAVFGGDAS
jgi:uncharacterized protein